MNELKLYDMMSLFDNCEHVLPSGSPVFKYLLEKKMIYESKVVYRNNMSEEPNIERKWTPEGIKQYKNLRTKYLSN